MAGRGWRPVGEGMGGGPPPARVCCPRTAQLSPQQTYRRGAPLAAPRVCGACVCTKAAARARGGGLQPSLPDPRPRPLTLSFAAPPSPTPPRERGPPRPAPFTSPEASRASQVSKGVRGSCGQGQQDRGPSLSPGSCRGAGAGAGLRTQDSPAPPLKLPPGALGLRGPAEESQATDTPVGSGGDHDGTSGPGPLRWGSQASLWSLAAGPRAVPGTGERGGAPETLPP